MLSFFQFSCGQRQEVKAKIVERRQVDKNRLMIRYQYLVDQKEYLDSSIVRNAVIAGDSIRVIINSKTPGKALPDLE